jgi:hypothetical protein
MDALVRGLDDPAPEVRFWSIYALACQDVRGCCPSFGSSRPPTPPSAVACGR